MIEICIQRNGEKFLKLKYKIKILIKNYDRNLYSTHIGAYVYIEQILVKSLVKNEVPSNQLRIDLPSVGGILIINKKIQQK